MLRLSPAGGIAALLLLAFASCGRQAAEPRPRDFETCGAEARCGDGQNFLIDRLAFALQETGGTVEGFNLDGLESAPRDREGCFTEDHLSPGGTAGVDNQLGAILKALPPTVLNVLPEAIQASINDGGLLFLVEIADADGLRGGPSPVVFRYGEGTPLLGTDRALLPGQTVELADDPLLGYVEHAVPDELGLAGGPFDLKFRMRFISTPVAFTFRLTRFRMQVQEDGTLEGVMGGAVTLEDLLAVVSLLGGDDTELRETLKALFPRLADVRSEPEGDCDALSGALRFHALPAFVFPASATGVPEEPASH